MNILGHEALAGTALTCEEHSDIPSRNFARPIPQKLDQVSTLEHGLPCLTPVERTLLAP